MNEGMSMNRTMRGLAVLAIGVGAWACKGDPQGDLRGDAVKVNATPSSIFVDQGETALVQIEVVDAQENALGVTDFAMTASSAVVSVAEDDAFNNIYDAAGNAVRPSPWTRARFEVTGVNTGSATLTASGGGISLDIPVRVVPVAIQTAAVSNINPVLGEVVTITLPAGVLADPATTQVLLPSSPTPVNVVVDPAGTSISFLPGPNTAEPATITNLTMSYAPGIPAFSLDTQDPITTPAITEVPVTWSNTSPVPGEVVRMTAGAGFQFDPATASVVSATFSTLIDAVDPAGTYIDVVFPIGAGGFEVVSGVISTAAPQFPLTVPTDVPINSVPATEPFAGTGDPVTAPILTLPTTPGTTVNIYDAGVFDATNGFFGFPTRYYRITVPANSTYAITVEWTKNDGDDLGLYLLDAAGATILDAADNNGSGSGAQPETATIALTAGSYLWANLQFSAASIGLVRYQITVQ